MSGQRMAIDANLIEADANKQNSTAKDDGDAARIDPADAPRAVREYLDTLDAAAFGAASPVEAKFTSLSDPASQWTAPRQAARELARTHQCEVSMKLRKKVEMLFAHLKRILGIGRLRLRGSAVVSWLRMNEGHCS